MSTTTEIMGHVDFMDAVAAAFHAEGEAAAAEYYGNDTQKWEAAIREWADIRDEAERRRIAAAARITARARPTEGEGR